MPSIYAARDASKIIINGHGIRVEKRFEISTGIFVVPPVMGVDASTLESRTSSHLEYAAILWMGGQSTFAIEITDAAGGEQLARRGWNALWLFGLLSMASRVPCLSLFAYSDGTDAVYSLASRNLIIITQGVMRSLSAPEADWMQRYQPNYEALISNRRFSTALRSYTNANYLFDLDQSLMLIWAGIEALLEVEAELTRRIALHAAILLDGSPDQKAERFRRVKAAYAFRSKIVHGAAYDVKQLGSEYAFASGLLIDLLAKCVTLGRVPDAKELDQLAAGVSVAS